MDCTVEVGDNFQTWKHPNMFLAQQVGIEKKLCWNEGITTLTL